MIGMVTVEAKFKELSPHLHGGTEGNRDNPQLTELVSRPSLNATSCPAQVL
jgi:hypothetical protein